MFYKQTPVKTRDMDWQLVARYLTVKSTDIFCLKKRKKKKRERKKENRQDWEIPLFNLTNSTLASTDR